MDNFFLVSCLLLASSSWVSASLNGGYYICDEEILASDLDECIFTYSGTQPDDWLEDTVEHAVPDDPLEVGDDFYRGVQSYTGTMLSVAMTPWVNGDALVNTDPDMVTGDLWSYALIFELMAPLRDMMMYDPGALADPDVWAKWTKALTDCNSKTEDYTSRSGGSPYSTAQVYEFMMDPQHTDIHHYILQYLEEGAVDIVCLSTDLDDSHCDAIREAAMEADVAWVLGVDRCDCWFDAYEAIYGVCPVVDMEFYTCPGTAAPTVCTDVEVTVTTTDDETDEGPSDLPSPPDLPDCAPDCGPPTRR